MKSKVVIYTFTRIIDNIKEDSFENYGNIKEIKISSIKNENNLETEIEEFLSNKNTKICILKFLPYEYFIIDYLKTVIENKEIEFNIKPEESKNKIFIFLVHLEREFNNVKQNADENDIFSRKKLMGSLSNLANYNQVFIDDINGEDFYDNNKNIITMNKLYDMSILDLYEIFINKQTIFFENIYSILCLFDLSFYSCEKKLKKMNKYEYINTIIKLFINDPYLNDYLDKIIIKSIKNKNKEDANKNILEKIIIEEQYSRGDICIFDIIKNFVIKIYKNEFKSLFIELEKNYFFSSLLKRKDYNFNTEEDENLKKFNEAIIEMFTNNFKIDNKGFEDEKLEIFFDFNLPSKSLLEQMDNFLKNNILDNYKKNEDTFRNFFPEDEEEFNYAKEQYENNLSIIENFTSENFSKFENIEYIQSTSKGVQIKFYNLLFEDYLTYIINKNSNDHIFEPKNDIKKLVEIIINYKFDKNTIYKSELGFLIKRVIWLETYYSESINPIVNFFLFLMSIDIKDIFKYLNNENLEDLYELKETEKIVNQSFFNIISKLIEIFILNFIDIIKKINNIESLKNLENNLVNQLESLKSVDNRLNLNCKKLFLFEEIIKISKFFIDNIKKEDFQRKKQLLLDLLLRINKINQDKNKVPSEMKENLKALKEEIKVNKKEYSEELFSSILIDEYKKESNEEYKKYILEYILDNENLIKYNVALIMDIIYTTIKQDICDAFIPISNDELYFPLLNNFSIL